MDVETLRAKYTALAPVLNERTRRLWAAAEAEAIGHGGIALVARATGMSRTRIARGIRQLRSDEPLEADRTRRAGGGRKRRVDTDATLVSDLNALLEPTTAGAPDDSPLRWTSKSIRTLTGELQALGHSLSRGIVHGLLHRLGYTLQANRKTKEGTQHPDRDAQFNYLNEQVQSAQEKGHPVISVDTKKKELIGDFKNGGRTWRPKRDPERVRVHDFVIPTQGKAIPYGIYDLSRNEGWVSVGITHDTAHFAVNAIRSWWKHMGRSAYGGTSHLLITADAGGSNGPPTATVEMGVAALCRSHRTDYHGLPLSSRHQQMEPHRASSVLVYRHELARPTLDQSGGGGPSDRYNDHHHRTSRSLRDRRAFVSQRGGRQR